MVLLLPPIDGIWEPKERCTSARGKVKNVKNSFRGNQSDVEPMDDFIVSAAVAHGIISLSRGQARARISQQNRRPLRTQAVIIYALDRRYLSPPTSHKFLLSGPENPHTLSVKSFRVFSV